MFGTGSYFWTQATLHLFSHQVNVGGEQRNTCHLNKNSVQF